MLTRNQLIEGKLIKRYKRFLADVEVNGKVITAHCPNSGSMKTCSKPESSVLLTQSNNPKRKLSHTLEFVKDGRTWVGVNTHLTNHLVQEALENQVIQELKDYRMIRREVKFGEKTRFDFLLQSPSMQEAYLEVKSVSLTLGKGTLAFPDAVTERGTKHLRELMKVVDQGQEAFLLFVIQRNDGHGFQPAWNIDSKYAETLLEAQKHGVQILANVAKFQGTHYKITSKSLPIDLKRVD